MEALDKTGVQIFDKIRGQFSNITLGDTEAESTQDPTAARFFNFDFVANGKNFGNVTISTIDENTIKIYFSKNITSELESGQRKIWYEFLKNMRKLAMTNMMRFDTHDISRPNLDINDIQNASSSANNFDSHEVRLGEGRVGKMYGTTKSSYQKFGPAKIIVRHSSKVDEEKRGSRSRRINALFIENDQGERFKLPFNTIPGARAMATHVGAGGQVYDDIGKSISEMVTELSNLQPFLRKNRTATFEDPTTTDMVEAAKNYYKEASKTLSSLKGSRGYHRYIENFAPTSGFDDFDQDIYKERFTDETTESALPSIHKAYTMKQQEMESTDPNEFENWANEMIEGDSPEIFSVNELEQTKELLSNPLPFGVDGTNAGTAIGDVYYDDDLLDELNVLSQTEGPEADAAPFIKDWIRDNDEALYDELGLEDMDAEEELTYDPETTGDDFDMDDEFDESLDIAALAGLGKGMATKKGTITPGEFGAFGRKPKGNDMRKGKFKKGPLGAKLALGEEGDEWDDEDGWDDWGDDTEDHAPAPGEYPDTALGAKEFLKYMADVDVSQAKVYPDPENPGVWKLDNVMTQYGPEEAIVYLPFITDSMGGMGDFEMTDDNDGMEESVVESKAIYSDYKKAFESFNTPAAVIEHLEGRGMKCCINVAEQMATHLGLDTDVLAEETADSVDELAQIRRNAGI